VKRYGHPLPRFAETYIKKDGRHKSERVVVSLHRWLRRNGKEIAAITGADLQAFAACPARRPVTQMTRNDYRYAARRYLRWLEERGLAGPFGARELEGYHRRPLPEQVQRFLRFLAPIRRRSTIRTYLGFLRRFHEWLLTRSLDIAQVDRDVCLEWAQQINNEGIAAATRVGMLICVRKYIDWLWDLGIVGTPGQALIRAPDLPKKPDYLPRPLPPDADQALQARFQEQKTPVALGLLVMRRAGLRLGELRNLERDCIRKDHVGGRFLKVPLGKLNNERLVPLDPKTLEAVQQLQRLGRGNERWLIEGARARQVAAFTYTRMLAKLGGGIALSEPLTSHRLRHTFASSLINGGMSLLGIMKLLGHRDQRMTLRYTAIADATVGREYFEALTRVTERYALPFAQGVDDPTPEPATLIQDAIRWLSKNLFDTVLDREARLLSRRLEAVRDELAELLASVEAIVR
jgi:site-specific recombinase XerD